MDIHNVNQQCIKLLKQNLQQARAKFAKGGSVGSLMDNGRIDMPIKPLTMKPMQVMQQMRTMLADGGLIDDESQIRYLISVLEGGHLNPLEQQLLLELYEDLKKLGGKNND
jgi:hypothetical protein